jgi:hypothetical protein
MNNRFPSTFVPSKRICVICEGYEEYDYLTRLKMLHVWRNDVYDVEPINAKALTNIPARYQDRYMLDYYDLVLVYCDTERKPYEDFLYVCKSIDKFHGIKHAANQVIFFVNPCTMQLMLLHFGDVRLKSNQKTKNARIIEDLTGINGYKASSEQRKVFMSLVNKDNFNDMLVRVESLPKNPLEIYGSNFNILVGHLKSESTKWMDVINNKLGG